MLLVAQISSNLCNIAVDTPTYCSSVISALANLAVREGFKVILTYVFILIV